MNRTPANTAGLVRVIPRWQIALLSVNDVIGSGVYLLPAAAAALLGPASTWAVILAGIAVILLVLCFAEASSYFEDPGGGYLYTREAFGPFIGFEVGWMTWLARIASVASLSNGLTLAVAYLWAPAATGVARFVLITAAIALLTGINVIGVRAGARTAVILVIAKTVPLAFFVLVGVFFVDWSRAMVFGVPQTAPLGEAALLLLFAYAGFENTPAPAGEYRDPRHDVPVALITAMLFITFMYSMVQLVSVGTVPDLATTESPLAEGAGRFVGAWGALLMTVGAVVSIFGNISNTILVGPRYLFALARDGFGPRVLARVHPVYRTPAAAILTQSAVSLVMALSGSFVQLALLSIVARLATYMGTAAAVPILRRRFGHRPGAFRLPGGPTVPIAALLISLIFLASTTWSNLVAGALALVLGAIIYRFRSRPPVPDPTV